jgi:hypothetical protein
MSTFIPKSKYSKSSTSGNEYYDPQTGQPYTGPIILTSNGAFMGTNSNTIKGKLLPLQKPKIGKTNLKQIASTSEYSALKPKISKHISSTSNIVPSKNTPTKQDYKRGYFIRYYVKRTNSRTFFEINKTTYNDLSSQNWKYDHNLYIPLKLKWALMGDVVKINGGILKRMEKTYPNISTLFFKLDEFKSLKTIKEPTSVITKNTNTKGLEEYSQINFISNQPKRGGY